jgi:hypothetical protein
MKLLNDNNVFMENFSNKITFFIMRVIAIMTGLTIVKRLFKPFLFIADTLQVSAPSAFQILGTKLVILYAYLARNTTCLLTEMDKKFN